MGFGYRPADAMPLVVRFFFVFLFFAEAFEVACPLLDFEILSLAAFFFE